jgi:hypothetical protein
MEYANAMRREDNEQEIVHDQTTGQATGKNVGIFVYERARVASLVHY